MDSAIILLFRSFTRYFLPGLVLLLVSIVFPLLLRDSAALIQGFGEVDALTILLLSLVFGYLLDSLGAYRWNLRCRRYNGLKRSFATELSRITGSTATDPDEHLAELWLADADTYERIFNERAEWVLILESSFALLLGFVVSIALALSSMYVRGDLCMQETMLGLLFVVASYITAGKGLQRMQAHNAKVLAAVRRFGRRRGRR